MAHPFNHLLKVPRGAVYSDPRILAMVFLGFSSGLPFLLTLATLHTWLSEVGIGPAVIGSFVLVTVPYTLKFLWAPLLDVLPFPYLSRTFGWRKGWMLGVQLCLMGALVGLGMTAPGPHTLWPTACWALVVAFFSATQDIVIEAYRIESLHHHKTGPGASASVVGYRLGLLVSGAGALYLSHIFSWQVVYAFMACCVLVGVITTLLSPEPATAAAPGERAPFGVRAGFAGLLTGDWMGRKEALWLFLFILCFKVGDTVLTVMTVPFLLDLGFTKLQIAHVGKAFGIGSMVLGGGFGGWMIARFGLSMTFLLYFSLQILSCGLFVAQAHLGSDVVFLYVSLGAESFTCGLGGAAFLTLLSRHCFGSMTASRFAILSSAASAARVVFSWVSGMCAEQVSWATFYTAAGFLCVPALLLTLYGQRSWDGRQGWAVKMGTAGEGKE